MVTATDNLPKDITVQSPVKEDSKPQTITSKVEQVFPASGYKDVPIIERNGWQKKFLGIPAWGWVVIGLCLVFGGLMLGIAVAVH